MANDLDVHSERSRRRLLKRIRGAEAKELVELDEQLAALRPSPARDALLQVMEDEVRRRDASGVQEAAIRREQELAIRSGDGTPSRFTTRSASVTPAERYEAGLAETKSAKAKRAAEVRWAGKREEGG